MPYADPAVRLERARVYNARWRAKNGRGYQRAYRLRAKAEAIAAYGGRCAECGERGVDRLVLDHIDANGRADRAERSSGRTGLGYHLALRRLGYPADPRLQVLCLSCHAVKTNEERHHGRGRRRPVPATS